MSPKVMAYSKNKFLTSHLPFYLLTCTGACLAIYQFIFNRSVWLDEASLSLCIINLDLPALLRPLPYNQVAPIGFLLIEKVCTYIFGSGEMAMRLFPLISFLCSLPFLYLLTRRITSCKLTAWVVTTLFALNPSIIYFASEIKQYMTDVLVVIVMIYLTISINSINKKFWLWYGLYGVMAILLSNISVIVLSVCGIFILYKEVISKKNLRPLSSLFIWAVFFGGYYLIFIYGHPTKAYMLKFWHTEFLPANPFDSSFWKFLANRGVLIYRDLVGIPGYGFYAMLLSLVGVTYAAFKKPIALLFIIGPIVLHLILSAFHLYPFYTRLILYLLPLVLIAIGMGITAPFRLLSKQVALPNILLAVPAIISLYSLSHRYPLQKSEIKKSVAVMDSNIQAGDDVFIYHKALHAYTYYRDIGLIKHNNPLKISSNWKHQRAEYMNELLELKGRVWILFADTYGDIAAVDGWTLDFLEQNDARILKSQNFTGSSIYLFDFNGINSKDTFKNSR
jgi:hypothetical protein